MDRFENEISRRITIEFTKITRNEKNNFFINYNISYYNVAYYDNASKCTMENFAVFSK